jgi:hypothetical protein
MTTTPEDEASSTTIDLSGFSMEPHVREAFNLAWSNSAGKPLSAARLLSAAVAVGGSEAFRELKERTAAWRVPASAQRRPKVPRQPSLDLAAVPVEPPLNRSFAIAQPFLSRGDRRIWGRDFVCLALWAPDDPALIKVTEAAGLDYEELRKGWLRFLLDSDIHRSAEEWQQWFEISEGFPPLSLDQLSPMATDALASAERSRSSRGASKIHSEDLLAGLYARPDAPLRLLFRKHGLGDSDLAAALMPNDSDGASVNVIDLEGGDPLTKWPALSRHAAEALQIARSTARSSSSSVIDAPHLLFGAMSVPQCSAVEQLARIGIHARDVTLTVDGKPPKEAPTPEREHVRLLVDETVGLDEDELGRRAIAEVLKDQLSRLLTDYPGRSFLVHVDGAWGAGKSTILRFLDESIERSHGGKGNSGGTSIGDWLVVTYDAWRQARVGPPWLTVLQALRTMVRSEQRCVTWFSIKERARLVGRWQWIAASVMLVTAIALIGLVVLAGSNLSLTSYGDVVKLLGGLLPLAAALWLIASSAGRFVTLDSRRSARTFLETRADPMEDLTSHFDWVLRQAGKPVLLLIDDLDRCPETFVVELLDSIQKLMRDPDPIHGAAVSDRRAAPLMVIVAADGRWLRSSYDNTYASLASAVKEPGATIGSLFLEKIFQLSVPVPTLSDDLRSAYLASMLAETQGPSQLMAGPSTELVQRLHEAAPEDRLGVLAAATPIERVKAAPEAVRLLVVEDHARAVTKHALEQYADLLDPTPRAMKRFVMEYFMLRAVRTAEGSVVERGPLALWTIVLTRWPLLAELLRNSPPSVQLFGSTPQQIPSSVPADIIDLFLDPPQELRNVMNHPDGPLDAERIRDASGQGVSPPRRATT